MEEAEDQVLCGETDSEGEGGRGVGERLEQDSECLELGVCCESKRQCA